MKPWMRVGAEGNHVNVMFAYRMEHMLEEFPTFDQDFAVRCIAQLFTMDLREPFPCFLLGVFVHRVVVPTRHLVEFTGGIDDNMEERQPATELLRQLPGVL